jgi:hypothetical protein
MPVSASCRDVQAGSLCSPGRMRQARETHALPNRLPAWITDFGHGADARLVRDRTEFFDECRAFLAMVDHECVVFS